MEWKEIKASITSSYIFTYRILNDLQFHPEVSKSCSMEQVLELVLVLVAAACRCYWVRLLSPWSNCKRYALFGCRLCRPPIIRWAAALRSRCG
jgi:hypothetical protein